MVIVEVQPNSEASATKKMNFFILASGDFNCLALGLT